MRSNSFPVTRAAVFALRRLQRHLIFSVILGSGVSALSQTPLACTQTAGPIRESSATLNGMAVSKSQPAVAWFEWGVDVDLGNATTPTNILGNSRVVRVRASLEGLALGAVYHYRLVVSNGFGVVYGARTAFTTGMRISRWATQGEIPWDAMPLGLSNYVQVACGHGHALALRNDGTVAAWAEPLFYGFNGQTNIPAGLSNVITLAGGYNHSLALREDGTLAAWGKTLGGVVLPPPAGLSNVIAVACGDNHSLALREDGTVVAWGDNSSGQTSVPPKLTNVVAIAAGSSHSVALTAEGTVVNWGISTTDTTPPRGLSNVVAISAESWHNMALKRDGTVVAWGANSYGQSTVPPGLSNVLAIAAGLEFSLALRDDGVLVGWGSSAYVGKLPTGFSNVVAIASGDTHSVALTPENMSPVAQSRAYSVLPNTDFVNLTVFGKDGNGDPLTSWVTSLPVRGALYQFATNGPGDPITSVPTLVSDSLHRVLLAPEPLATGAPYAIVSFLVNDGFSNSAPATATVSVLPPPTVLPLGFINTGTNQGFAITFTNLPTASFYVLSSENGSSWSTQQRCTEVSPGSFFFVDTRATNANPRLYRVRSPY